MTRNPPSPAPCRVVTVDGMAWSRVVRATESLETDPQSSPVCVEQSRVLDGPQVLVAHELVRAGLVEDELGLMLLPVSGRVAVVHVDAFINGAFSKSLYM